MILIAHRGLADGPNPERENHPEEIVSALKRGFEAEIDVRVIDDKPWLGHDGPEHLVSWEFIDQKGLWIHAKDLETLDWLMALKRNVFFHDQDDAVLTGNGSIWTYPGKPLYSLSVCVQPEWNSNWRENVGHMSCLGICSKYVAEIQRIRAGS